MHQTKLKTGMTDGPLFWKMLFYALPLMLSGMLQVCYNVADTMIVGKYTTDSSSLAAVGSTGSLTNLIINLLFGLSAGTSVLVSQYYGSKQYQSVKRTVHTSVSISFVGGIVVGIIGAVFSRPLLLLMGSPEDVIGKASLYMTIIFIGMPASSVFNFASAILRARGDTQRPLFILAFTGLLNIGLSLIFIKYFNMDVAGVALGTIISQYVSAIAVMAMLFFSKEHYRFRFSELCIDKKILKRILFIGLPAGIQGSMFSISNVIIQSSVNTLPTDSIAGNTIGVTLEGLAYNSMNAFYQTSLTFTGQNYGANKRDRIRKVLRYAVIQVIIVGLVVSYTELFFGTQLISLFTKTEAVKEAALVRMNIIFRFYFLCGVMEVLVGRLRGVGHSVVPMISSIFGACIFRIGWVLIVFNWMGLRSPEILYVSFPISWALVLILHSITIFATRKKLTNKMIASELKTSSVDSIEVPVSCEC